MSRPALRG